MGTQRQSLTKNTGLDLAPQSTRTQPPEFSFDQAIAPLARERQAKPKFRGLSHELASSPSSPIIQAKLTIGQPDDRYEREADRIASDVVQKIHSPQLSQQAEGIQRKDQEEIQPRLNEAIASDKATPDLESSIQNARGSGKPLADTIRKPMEQAFSSDFSGVKVHTDWQSNQLNQSIQAKAFTTGQDIFFREGAYDLASPSGQELIAHELAHVVQQNGGDNLSNTTQRKTFIQRNGDGTVMKTRKTKQKHKKVEDEESESEESPKIEQLKEVELNPSQPPSKPDPIIEEFPKIEEDDVWLARMNALSPEELDTEIEALNLEKLDQDSQEIAELGRALADEHDLSPEEELEKLMEESSKDSDEPKKPKSPQDIEFERLEEEAELDDSPLDPQTQEEKAEAIAHLKLLIASNKELLHSIPDQHKAMQIILDNKVKELEILSELVKFYEGLQDVYDDAADKTFQTDYSDLLDSTYALIDECEEEFENLQAQAEQLELEREELIEKIADCWDQLNEIEPQKELTGKQKALKTVKKAAKSAMTAVSTVENATGVIPDPVTLSIKVIKTGVALISFVKTLRHVRNLKRIAIKTHDKSTQTAIEYAIRKKTAKAVKKGMQTAQLGVATSVYGAGKSVYKRIKRTRGVNRLSYADTLQTEALAGNLDAQAAILELVGKDYYDAAMGQGGVEIIAEKMKST